MPRFNYIQNSFVTGELTPKSHGRTDLPQYQHGVETLKNFVAQVQGGATRRMGTKFIIDFDNATGASTKSRLIPFIFSETESYLLLLQEGSQSFAILNVNDEIFSLNSLDATSPGFPRVDTAGDFVSQTAFTADELDTVQYAQKGDVLYVVQANHPPMYIKRIGLNQFQTSMFYLDIINPANEEQMVDRFPYFPPNANTAHTLQYTAGPETLDSSVPFFDINHVGAVFKLTSAAPETGAVVVTGYVNETQVLVQPVAYRQSDGDLAPAVTGVATDNWEESAWSNYRGWPRAISFFDRRLVMGGASRSPNTIWFSEQDDIQQFMQLKFEGDATYTAAPTGTDPFSLEPDSNTIDEIQWLQAGENLNIGTRGAEYIAAGTVQGEAISFDNAALNLQTSHGSAYQQATRIGNGVVFLDKSAFKVREFKFTEQEQNFISTDLSILSEHLYRSSQVERSVSVTPKVSQWAFQDSPGSVLWLVDSNGGFYGMTREPTQQLTSWHRHELGGYLNVAQNDRSELLSLVSLNPSADAVVAPTAAGLVTEGTDTINIAAHAFNNGQRILYTTDTTAIGGLTDNGTYFIVNKNAGDFQLATSPGGTVIDLTDDGVGNHTFTPVLTTIDNFLEVENSFADGQVITYQTAGTVIAGLVTNTEYFVSNPTPFKFALTSAKGGPKLSIDGSAATGQHSVIPNDVNAVKDQVRIVDHDLVEGQLVTYRTGGTVINGLTDETNYYVRSPESDAFSLSLTPTGALIDFTTTPSSGTGLQEFTPTEPPFVESVAVLPSADATKDIVYLLVKRTINHPVNGIIDRHFIERLNPDFDGVEINPESTNPDENPIYTDSAIYSEVSTAVASCTGLQHAQGSLLQVYGDGFYLGDIAVGSGTNNITDSDGTALGAWTQYADTYVASVLVPSATGVNIILNRFNFVAHGLVEGQLVNYVAGGTPVGGLVPGADYIVVNANANDFQLEQFRNGEIVDLTSIGVGNQTFVPVSSTPVRGTGGAPGVTVAVNAGLFEIDLNAAAIGEGVSYDFTIPTAESGGAFKFEITYNGTIGGFSTGDIRFYVLNVDSNIIHSITDENFIDTKLIDFFTKNTGMVFEAASQTVSGLFPTKAGDLNYRLIMHVAAAPPAAIVTFDDVSIAAVGKLTLPQDTKKCIAGYKYCSEIKTLKIEAGSAIGSAQGSIKRVDRAVLRFDKTVGGQLGSEPDKLEEIQFRPSTLKMNEPTPLFTGDKRLDMPSTPDRAAQVIVKQELPLPMRVLSIIQRGVESD